MKRWAPLSWMALGSALTVGLAGAVAGWPSTWRKSAGMTVTTFSVPLGIKLAAFSYRQWMYEHLVEEITQGLTDDRARVEAIFDWTVAHIRTDVPQGWVVEDDHPLHVIVRGYGADWQVTDVFTLLCAYAGYPGMMASAKTGSSRGRVLLALVQLNGRWRVYDPYHRNRFVAADGSPVDLAALQADPALAARAAHQPVIDGMPYLAYFRQVRPLERGPFLRPNRHMWWPRIWQEMHQWGRRVAGVGA